jgi:rhodanese-related sulfurtransferase
MLRTAFALFLLSLTACSAQSTLMARAPLALQAQSAQAVRPQAVTTISVQEAHQWLSDPHSQWLVLDVRTPEEFAQGHLANATLKNFYDADFKAQLEQLNRWQPTILYCRSGNRSAKTLTLMRELGFRNVYEVKGGVLAWQAAGFPLQS